MSTVASFIRLPISELPVLRAAASPLTINEYAASADDYRAFLVLHGQRLRDYDWPGNILITLLHYLKEEHEIDLLSSDFDGLAEFLTTTRGSQHVMITHEQSKQYLETLCETEFFEGDLQNYFETANQEVLPESGAAMWDGIETLKENLTRTNEESVIVLHIE